MAQPDDWAMPAYRNVKLFWWPWAVPMGGGAVRSPNPLRRRCSALLLKMRRGWRPDGVRAGHAPAARAAADNPRTSRAGHIGGLERPRLAPRRQHAGSAADAEPLRERVSRQQRNRLRFRGLAYKCGEHGPWIRPLRCPLCLLFLWQARERARVGAEGWAVGSDTAAAGQRGQAGSCPPPHLGACLTQGLPDSGIG